MAELEAGLIAQRTKAALTAAKARGVQLGGWRGGPKVDPSTGREARTKQAEAFAATLAPIVAPMREAGASLREVAVALTERGIRTPRGGAWSAAAVKAVLDRVAPQQAVITS